MGPISPKQSLRVYLCALLVLLSFAASPAEVHAAFTQATLLSGTAQFEFDEANAPAFAADGRYVVFQGSLANVPGIYRRDLQTGAVTLVVGGNASDPRNPCDATADPLAACDAAAPSVSADGRYVAFTTTADLEPAKAESEPGEPASDRGCPEVYVRDMEVEPNAPGAYTLASAFGSGQGIVYAGSCPAQSSGFAVAGAQAAPGVALSADGRHVVFTVLSPSNPQGGAECSDAEPKGCTAPSQVMVRDLQARTTTLVTVTPLGQPTPEGGAYPSSWSEQHAHISGPTEYADEFTASSAAISSDASTVAWLGTNVPAQVPSATEIEGDMKTTEPGQSRTGSEVEPLWRRIADGQEAVTRRLLNEAGIDFYPNYLEPGEAVDGGALAMPALQGDYFIPPALSADGRTVAVVANAPVPSAEASLIGQRIPSTNAYVIHMREGAAPVVTRLTEITDYSTVPSALGNIKDVALSPDGARMAFDTTRTQFDLPTLALISSPSTYTDVAETYEANLELGTLERVTSTYDGSEPNHGAGLLSFSGDGRTLAFASEATNLFFGDAIPAWEVYAAAEAPVSQVAPQQIGATPQTAPPTPLWLLSATASAAADGSVVVDAQVPGGGQLTIRAAAQLPSHRARPARSERRAHSPAKRANVARRLRRAKADAPTSIQAHTVAQAKTIALVASELRVRLRATRAYRMLVDSRDGLYAVLRIAFSAPGHKTLTQEIPITFRRVADKSRTRGKTRVTSRPAHVAAEFSRVGATR